MYAIGAEHKLKEPSIKILRDCVQKTYFTYTNVEVLQEILHRYTHLGKRQQAIDAANKLAKLVTQVLPVTLNDFSSALRLHGQYKQLTARDSIHAATALNHHLTHILSADKHFNHIPGFVRIDPRKWDEHVALMENIR